MKKLMLKALAAAAMVLVQAAVKKLFAEIEKKVA